MFLYDEVLYVDDVLDELEVEPECDDDDEVHLLFEDADIIVEVIFDDVDELDVLQI